MIKSPHLLISHYPQHHAVLLKVCLFALSAPLISHKCLVTQRRTSHTFAWPPPIRLLSERANAHTRHEKGGCKHKNKPETTPFHV